MITIEAIEKKLKKHGVPFKKSALKGETFERILTADFLGIKYEINWYHNIGYLKRDGLTIVFDDLVFNGHFPNGFKTSAVFLENGKVNARIGSEEYLKENGE